MSDLLRDSLGRVRQTPAISDDTILDIYTETHNISKVCIATGLARRTIQQRLQRLRSEGKLVNNERSLQPLYEQRDPSTVTDDELWSQYELTPNDYKVAEALCLAPQTVRERLVRLRIDRAPVMQESVNAAGALEKLFASVPIKDPNTGAEVKEISLRLHEGFYKDEFTQTGVKVPMDGVSAKYRVDRPAVVIEPFDTAITAYSPTGIRDTKSERVFVVGDQQMGFWAIMDEKDPKRFRFVPFHDLRAQDIQLKAISLYRPDRIVIVGDYFDFPQLSKFQQEPAWAQTMQATIQDGYDYLRKIRKTAGDDCKIDFIPGNHETRMQRAICNNNPALYNLRRPGEKHSIYSVPSLMKFDTLGIECAAEYPSGEVWIAQRRGRIPGFVITHADPRKKDLRADSMHGHLVLPSWEVRQVFYEDGPVTYRRWCVSGAANYGEAPERTTVTRTNTSSGRARMAAIPSFATIDIDRKTGLRFVHVWDYDSATGVQFSGKTITSNIKTPAAA